MLTRMGRAAIVAALAVSTVTTVTANPATAAEAPLSHPRITAHLDLTGQQQPENIVLEPNGSANVTFAFKRQVARISSDGRVRVLATFPDPGAGHTAFLGGIVRDADGTLYVVYGTGTSELTGIWRVSPRQAPVRIAALPATGFANGLAFDARSGMLYVTDSTAGVIRRVKSTGGEATVWVKDPKLDPISLAFGGVNGIKVRDGAVWATNLEQGLIVRVPIQRSGNAGPVSVFAQSPSLVGIDDFDFTAAGEILAAVNQPNQVVLVNRHGTPRVVLDASDGLQGPTSVAVSKHKAYVPSAAYFTATDPNLLRVHLT